MNTELLDLSRKLISIPSTKENAKGLTAVLEVANNALSGFNKVNYYKNGISSILFYNTKNAPKRFKVILNGHLDVVPGKQFQFKPVVKADKLYGRGSLDMKSAAAVMMIIFKEFAMEVNYPLGLQLVTDEEVGGFNGVKHQVESGVRSDFVITGESSNFEISNMSKGVFWVKLKAKGKTAHGAYPWNGSNAYSLLAKTLNKIWVEFPIPTHEVWKTTVNVGRIITTNETYNKVPDYAEAWLDIRYVPQEKEVIEKKIRSLLTKNVTLDTILKEPPHYTHQTNKYIALLKKSIRNVSNMKAVVTKRHGANDVRHFNKVGCDGVEFGPIGEGIHTDKEWVSIKSLKQYREILKDFLLSLN